MKVEKIPELALNLADDRAIATLMADAFGPDFNGRAYFRQRHHLRLIVRDGDRIIGHIALLMRDIRVGGALVPVIGVAEVATDPDHRGRGIAAALLQEAITVSRQSLADFMVLFGDRPMYAGHGFLRANNTLSYTLLDDARTQGIKTRVDEGLMILPLRDAAWNFGAHVDLVGHLF
ncbi:GNAT family N-acetyltransferase [Loktanella sp. SALINAS62]|uniref:GNAT family N-acetyltransferase n=1 Tax=Loktanella sp. SALINAS62 TaxID=2706124 RepID=UPI001B8B5B7A|nr:GNAT family N-acetyltransferase [Loktanella sp. SALINAS62]MBS1301882.1 GNAT family N-acetyltransferase [Loktanella sp. SALINAS62]